ncbi:hypothetical protein ACHAWO_007107 [Cyclotella atomus]|uniref:TFIIS N-terminal domain-containing protein n=1 Tax=Cyclotella atomus TaxID=382360 RepID=A0ABD3P4T2_9STRA
MVPPMKLSEEQCSNLLFPVGCRVWYNPKLDGLRCNDMPNANKDSALHAAAMEEKWGALLGTSSNAAAATVEDESQGKAVLTLNSGIVSAAYLDMNVRDVMYEISPLNEKGEISSPETNEHVFDQRIVLWARYTSSFTPCFFNIRQGVYNSWTSSHVPARQQVPEASLNSTSEQRILAIKQKMLTEADDEVIQNELCKLNNVDITIEILKSTGIGKQIARLKKSPNKTIALLAKELVAKWKDISHGVKAPDSSLPVAKEAPEFLYTIEVHHDNGCFHIEENVSVDRFKYRHVESANLNYQAVSEPSQQPYKAEVSSNDTPHASSNQQSDSAKIPLNDAPHAPEQIDLKPHARNELVGNPTANADIDLLFQEHEGCPMASPSTLTHSDTTTGQSNSDAHSQQNSHKRKFEPDQLEESAGQKRPCSSCRRYWHCSQSTIT